jgi:hypothetical protein
VNHASNIVTEDVLTPDGQGVSMAGSGQHLWYDVRTRHKQNGCTTMSTHTCNETNPANYWGSLSIHQYSRLVLSKARHIRTYSGHG